MNSKQRWPFPVYEFKTRSLQNRAPLVTLYIHNKAASFLAVHPSKSPQILNPTPFIHLTPILLHFRKIESTCKLIGTYSFQLRNTNLLYSRVS